jgi:hypothetical protein
MRRPRLKPPDIPIFYHLYNRVAGEPGFLPFGPACICVGSWSLTNLQQASIILAQRKLRCLCLHW